MAVAPSNTGAQWAEAARAGASLATSRAGYRKDGSGNFYPSTEGPFEGMCLDLAGDGHYTVTDITAGTPAYVSELKMVSIGGHFYSYVAD